MTNEPSGHNSPRWQADPNWVAHAQAQHSNATAGLPGTEREVLASAGSLIAAGVPVALPPGLEAVSAHNEAARAAEDALRAVEDASVLLDQCCDDGVDPDETEAALVARALSLRTDVEFATLALRHWSLGDFTDEHSAAVSAANELLEHRRWILGCASSLAAAALREIEPRQRRSWWWLGDAERFGHMSLLAMHNLGEWVAAFPQAREAWERVLTDAAALGALSPQQGTFAHAAAGGATRGEPDVAPVVSLRDWLQRRSPPGAPQTDALRAAAAGPTDAWTVLCEVDGITASHVDNTWLWLNVPASTVVEGVPTLHLPGGSSLAFEVLKDDPGSYRITLTEDALDAARVRIRVVHASGLTELALPSDSLP